MSPDHNAAKRFEENPFAGIVLAVCRPALGFDDQTGKSCNLAVPNHNAGNVVAIGKSGQDVTAHTIADLDGLVPLLSHTSTLFTNIE